MSFSKNSHIFHNTETWVDLEGLVQDYFSFTAPLSEQQLNSIWDLVQEANDTLGDYPLLERFGFRSGIIAIFSDTRIFNAIHNILSK